MKVIRILSLLLALLMLVMSLASCNLLQKPEDPEADAGDQTEAPGTQEKVKLELVDKGTPNYVIVRDYKAGPKTVDAIAALVLAFKEVLNCEITVRECYADREVEEDVPEEKEILIGATNREESIQALDGKKASDYVIGIYGEKVVVAGGSDEYTATAIVRFMNLVVYEQGDRAAVKDGKKLDLVFDSEMAAAKEFNSTGTYSYNKAEICDARIDSYALIYPGSSKMSTQYKLFATEMQTYIKKEAGYELPLYKDSRATADYEILVGDTLRTDAGIVKALEDDEYYIAASLTETGAQVTVLFGKEAYDAAMTAFKTIMPTSQTPINFAMADGFVYTNME